MNMADVSMVEVPAQLVLGIRRRGHYSDIAAAIGEVVQYALAHGAQLTGAPIALLHEHGREAAMEADANGTAVIDVAFPIARRVPGGDSVKCYELPGGTMAKLLYKGPYEACEAAYTALFDWIVINNYLITGPTREVYLNDPREVGPEETLTEIYAPIERT
jgi:AraC family transcriptional regulator